MSWKTLESQAPEILHISKFFIKPPSTLLARHPKALLDVLPQLEAARAQPLLVRGVPAPNFAGF